MDSLAFSNLASIKNIGVPIETKVKHLTELKAEIKHRHCPEGAVAPLFDVVRAAISTPHLTDVGFSILGHLTKRLELQDQDALLQAQGLKTYPTILDRLGDHKDRIRSRAIQAITDFHVIAPTDVEQFVRDNVLTSKSPRAKEAGMYWIGSTRKEKNIQFRAFVPHIVDCLEDADGSVRQTAQATLISLFQNANARGMHDLQKHLQHRNVRRTIVERILCELGITGQVETERPTSNPTHASEASRQVSGYHAVAAGDPPTEAPPMSISEQEAVHIEPLYIESTRDLEDNIRDMQPCFEGKESEHNWLRREKSVLKLRKITKGNAPQDFPTAYTVGIKGLLDGVLKVVNSLRTTLCTIGCHLIQDITRVVGSGLDGMVEILLQNLIKLCANTKKIAAAKGNDTVTSIMANVSYNVRLVQHIYAASQDKNVQPRLYACGWLKTLIGKHGHNKSAIEHAGGLDLIEKCLKIGLVDRDPSVRENIRPTYWAFARRWPDKSEAIMTGLGDKQQELLIKDPSNPNPQKQSAFQASLPGDRSAFSQSTTSAHAKPSIKETIAAQKRAAKAAGKNLPSRPGSAEPFGSPKKILSQASIGRPGTSMSRNVSVTSVGTLSSAPVRPRRRADVTRPATADPYATRKAVRTDTPPRSPAASPNKRIKTPAAGASSVKLVPKKVNSPAASPSKGDPSKRVADVTEPRHIKSASTDSQTRPSPTRAVEDFTMVIPNLKASKSTYFAPSQHDPQMADTLLPDANRLEDPFSPARPMELPMSVRGGANSRTSPTKVVPDFARLSIDGDKEQRISMSPGTIASRKENLMPKSLHSQDQRPLKVYEDPVRDLADDDTYPSPLPHTPRVLEELPVNEPTMQHRLGLNHQLLAEESQSPDYHQKWLAVEAAEQRRVSGSENVENPHLVRKILDSGIDRVRARNLDVHGFRKLQTLIRTSGDSMWEDGYKFDELALPLLDYLEFPNDDSNPRTGKAQDLKTQVLVTIRLMLQHQPKLFSNFHPRALSAILNARKHYKSTSHIVCGLEETAESIVTQCNPIPCIDSVLDLLETEPTEGIETHTVFMGLYVLAGLLHRCQEKTLNIQLNSEQEARLGRMASRCLSDTNPDIRRAVIEFVLEMHDSVEQARFWNLVGGTKAEHRSLITYYLARKRAAAR